MAEEGNPGAPQEALLSAGGFPARVRTEFESFITEESYSCLGARAALRQPAYRFRVFGPLATTDTTAALARELATWLADPMSHGDFSTFVAAFLGPAPASELEFERRLWKQLGRLHRADPLLTWAPEVSDDPVDPRFSFSFAGHAFFVVGLHPESSRQARRFAWPTLVFNPHAQFQRLRADGRFAQLREQIRLREMKLQGTLNPNLADFGEQSEARQYSGRAVEPEWRCPFHRKSR